MPLIFEHVVIFYLKHIIHNTIKGIIIPNEPITMFLDFSVLYFSKYS